MHLLIVKVRKKRKINNTDGESNATTENGKAGTGPDTTGPPPAKVIKTSDDNGGASNGAGVDANATADAKVKNGDAATDATAAPAVPATVPTETTKPVAATDAAPTPAVSATPSATDVPAAAKPESAPAPATVAEAQPHTLASSGVPSGVPGTMPSNVPTGVPGVPPGVPGVPAAGVPGVPSSTPSSTSQVQPQPQAAPLAGNVNAIIIEKGEVATHYVGRVIGKGGEQIRDLQARSGCKIDVDQNVPAGAPRVITYQGTRKTIDFAKTLVAILCSESGKDAKLPLGEAKKKQLQVPATVIGKIIGRGGEMIKELQSKSQAKIQIDHSGAGGVDPSMRLVTVIGTEQSVIKAEEMITFLIGNPGADAMNSIAMLVREKMQGISAWGSGPPYTSMPNNGQGMSSDINNNGGGGGASSGGYGEQGSHYGSYGGGYGNQQQGQSQGYGFNTQSEIFPCSKMYMGRVIGQKGVTINDLQKRSGCDIQINQDVPPGQDCEITIKGSRQGIESVKRMLSDIIELGPNHPYAGGGGGGGGGGGARQQQQQSGYGQQNMYGQQQGYYPQQQYGQQQFGIPQQQFGQHPQQQQQQQQPIYGGAYPQPTAYAYQQQPQQQQQFGQQQFAYQQPTPMAVPAMVSPWKAAVTTDGQTYYYNEKTGATTWEKPAGM